jgi:hypothetical protein
MNQNQPFRELSILHHGKNLNDFPTICIDPRAILSIHPCLLPGRNVNLTGKLGKNLRTPEIDIGDLQDC